MKGEVMFGPLSAKQLNIIRGKMLMVHPPGHDIWKVFGYIDWLEEELNNLEDALGTEGWRHTLNHPDAD